jgi:hypothetical protein
LFSSLDTSAPHDDIVLFTCLSSPSKRSEPTQKRVRKTFHLVADDAYAIKGVLPVTRVCRRQDRLLHQREAFACEGESLGKYLEGDYI